MQLLDCPPEIIEYILSKIEDADVNILLDLKKSAQIFKKFVNYELSKRYNLEETNLFIQQNTEFLKFMHIIYNKLYMKKIASWSNTLYNPNRINEYNNFLVNNNEFIFDTYILIHNDLLNVANDIINTKYILKNNYLLKYMFGQNYLNVPNVIMPTIDFNKYNNEERNCYIYELPQNFFNIIHGLYDGFIKLYDSNDECQNKIQKLFLEILMQVICTFIYVSKYINKDTSKNIIIHLYFDILLLIHKLAKIGAIYSYNYDEHNYDETEELSMEEIFNTTERIEYLEKYGKANFDKQYNIQESLPKKYEFNDISDLACNFEEFILMLFKYIYHKAYNHNIDEIIEFNSSINNLLLNIETQYKNGGGSIVFIDNIVNNLNKFFNTYGNYN